MPVLLVAVGGCVQQPAPLANAQISFEVQAIEPVLQNTTHILARLLNGGPDSVRLDPLSQESGGTLRYVSLQTPSNTYESRHNPGLCAGAPGCEYVCNDLTILGPGRALEVRYDFSFLLESGNASHQLQAGENYTLRLEYSTLCPAATWRGLLSAEASFVVRS